MRAHSHAFREAIRSSHRRAVRVTTLDANLNPLLVLTGEGSVTLGGSVQQDRGRETRRTCSLEIVNPDGTWTPTDQLGAIYWSKPLKIERGVYVAGVPELISLGVFVIDRPSVEVTARGNVLRITGRDRFKLAEKSKFTASTTIASGTRIRDTIRALAEGAGMGTADALYALDDAGKTLLAARTWEQGEERLRAMLDVASAYSMELYMDADGRLALRPELADPFVLPSVYDFAPGDVSIMLGLSKSWSDERFYNHVLVTGEGAELGTVYKGEAMDLNPASPGYIYGGVGDRLYTYSSAMIRSNAQAQEVADALLPNVALIEEELAVPSIVHPALEAGDVIAVTEASSRTEGYRYRVDRLSIPLGEGSMTIGARRLRRFT